LRERMTVRSTRPASGLRDAKCGNFQTPLINWSRKRPLAFSIPQPTYPNHTRLTWARRRRSPTQLSLCVAATVRVPHSSNLVHWRIGREYRARPAGPQDCAAAPTEARDPGETGHWRQRWLLILTATLRHPLDHGRSRKADIAGRRLLEAVELADLSKALPLINNCRR